MRMVEASEWCLTGMQDEARRVRLLNPPVPADLIAMVTQQTLAKANEIVLTSQSGDEMVGCKRPIAVIPVHPITFDALFHGRSGYRAQYYLSRDDGAKFNRLLVDGLIEVSRLAYSLAPIKLTWEVVERSFRGPWSKVWIHGDGEPFKGADRSEFRPKRWVEDHPLSHWLAAPLPDTPAIDLKGCWIYVASGELRRDPLKDDRDDELSKKGGA